MVSGGNTATKFRELYSLMTFRRLADNPMLKVYAKFRGVVNSEKITRRGTAIAGGVTEVNSQNDLIFPGIQGHDSTLTIDTPITRAWSYDARKSQIYGGMAQYLENAREAGMAARQIEKYICNRLSKELLDNAPTIESVNAFSSDQNIQDYFSKTPIKLKTRSRVDLALPVHILIDPDMETKVVDYRAGKGQSDGAATIRDGWMTTKFGALTYTTLDIPTSCVLNITTNAANGDTLKFNDYHPFKVTFQSANVTENDFNKVKIGSDAAATETNLANFLNADVQTWDSTGKTYSRKSVTTQVTDIDATNNFLELVDTQLDFDATIPTSGTNQNKIELKMYGGGRFNIQKTGTIVVAITSKVLHTFMFVPSIDKAVTYALSSNVEYITARSQHNPDNPNVVKASLSSQWGKHVYPDQKFNYVKQDVSY